MGGNEPEECVQCKQALNDEQGYLCDLCASKLHKNCAVLSSSEIRCMPLQKRVLTLLCVKCREFLGKAPYLANNMEHMVNNMKLMMNKIENLEHNQKKMIVKIENLEHKIVELRTELGKKEKFSNNSYAQMVKNENKTTINRKTQLSTLIIKPKGQLDAEQTKKLVLEKIKPEKLEVGITSLRSTKNGNLIVKCSTKNEIDSLKKVMDTQLKNKLEAFVPERRLPRVKVVGYTGNNDIKYIETSIKQQNRWLRVDDKIAVSFVKQNKGNKSFAIYLECSPSVFMRLMDVKNIYIGWNRCRVFEDITVTRCFKCQGFHHKSNQCTNKTICGNCGEEHETNSCTNNQKKCINCYLANKKLQTNYNIQHCTSAQDCPSLIYQLGVIRNKIDYGDPITSPSRL